MATTEMTTENRVATQARDQLQRYNGSFCPGICFASGHCFWLFKWDHTPTSVGPYSDVWIITPDGDRLLFADPPEAGPIVEKWHDFDQTNGATITWDRIDDDGIELSLEGDDDTTVDLTVELGSTAATRLLNTISSLTPKAFLRTSIGQTISNLSLASLMDVNGMKIAGVTETREPYRFEADRMRAVKDATVTLNGEDLGEFSPPDRPIVFGDAKTPDDAFFAVADVYLRPP